MALKDADKQSRMAKVADLMEQSRLSLTKKSKRSGVAPLPLSSKSLEKHAMRVMVVETGERVDGRAADEIRPIMVKPDYLPLVHGSGLFQRGQTQVLPSAPLVCSMNGSVLIPLSPLMASAISTITTSRRSAPEKPAAWEAQAS